MVDNHLTDLKKNMKNARQFFRVSFFKSVVFFFLSIIASLFSVLSMYLAAAERHTTIKMMWSNRIFGGEWMVVIGTICLIIYTAMMIWQSFIAYRECVHSENNYIRYRKVLNKKYNKPSKQVQAN